MFDIMRHRPLGECSEQGFGHCIGHLIELFGRNRVAELPFEAGAFGVSLAGGIETNDAEILVDHLQASADMISGGRQNAALFDQRQLGRAAANVDIENALFDFLRNGGCT